MGEGYTYSRGHFEVGVLRWRMVMFMGLHDGDNQSTENRNSKQGGNDAPAIGITYFHDITTYTLHVSRRRMERECLQGDSN